MRKVVYTTRARCDCGFLWSQPGSPNVQCSCTATLVEEHMLVRGPNLAFTEEEFKQACADDIGVDVSEIDVVHQEE